MAYPNRGLLKAAMGHYLTESARTALEALSPDENVIDMGPGKQMPAVGPNQLLDMPLFTKIPFLPGSNTLFYTTNLGEKLYQPSATFDLNDPYCKIMAPKYKSLHDPHLRHYYKRKDNLRRLKKAGHITDKNKVVCSLKEFNEYRQYLTTLKLDFEKNYMREQKILEKQITKLQEARALPEAADTSKYRDWLLKEERPSIQEQENVMRNRYIEMINQELEKLERLAEENRCLALAQDDRKKQSMEKRKQLLLRKKMEEEWRKKEMMLLMKIGDDVKREARIEEQRRKSQEDKLKKKQVVLEKKMTYHLKKLQERFRKEGLLLPSDKIFAVPVIEDHGPEVKKEDSLTQKSVEDSQLVDLNQKPTDTEIKGLELPKGNRDSAPDPQGPPALDKKTLSALPLPEPGSASQAGSRGSVCKGRNGAKMSLLSLVPQLGSESVGSKSQGSMQQDAVTTASERERSKTESLNSELGGECTRQGSSGKVSFSPYKEVSSLASTTSNDNQATDFTSGRAGSNSHRILASTSGICISTEGGLSGCGSAGCGSKNSCGRSAGCGSKTSCCGSAGCGSKTSCCGSAGCGSKTSCCGSAGCCSNKDKCFSSCGSGGCCSANGKSGCCGEGGCGSNNGRANGGYDSSGSSRHGHSSGTNKLPFLPSDGANLLQQTSVKTSTKATFSAASPCTVSESTGKAKQKKRATVLSEPDSQPKERNSSKKRRVEKDKIEHIPSTSQENEDSESTYSAYLQRLLSNSDQSAIRDSLKGKVSVNELNSIIQNIMTWVVSAVTSILYPALTKFEERVRTRVYTISEESVVSSENSSSCSTCNEELFDHFGSLPSSSTRKVNFTDTSMKPTSSPSEFQTTSGKPTSLLSSKSSFTSFTKSTPMSLDSDLFKGKFKRGKTAIFLPPSKHNGLLSTTASMRSSKSDSHIFQAQKSSADSSDKPAVSYHCKRKYKMPDNVATKGPLSKADATTKTEGLLFGGGEQKPPCGTANQGQAVGLRDLKSIFADLKSHVTQITAVLLDDIFRRLLSDLGFAACSASITQEVLLKSISDSLLGSCPAGSPVRGSASRLASVLANDIVENVLAKLQSTAQKKYFETISKEDFSAGCKAMCIVATGKHSTPDPALWRARIPLSFESVYGIAEEILQMISDKLKVFATSSQTKLSQFELCANIKTTGIPLEHLYTAIPPHTIESEAASLIVKDVIRKVVSKTVSSSEANIVQHVEVMIGSILSYIQRQMSQNEIPPTRESSILLQLVNDVFNDLSTEKLTWSSLPIRSRTNPELPGDLSGHEPSPAHEPDSGTVDSAEKRTKQPFAPVSVPGMATYSEAEFAGKEKMEPDGSFLSVNKDQAVMMMEDDQDKVRYETFGLESRRRRRASTKSGEGASLEKEGKAEAQGLGKTENNVDNFVQDAIFSSLDGQQVAKMTPEQTGQQVADWSLEQALKKMEEDFKAEEQASVIEESRNLLNEIFQNIWAEQPVWPPATPPPSAVHLSISRNQAEEQPDAKGQMHFSSQHRITDSDLSLLACDLVKTVFQKISSIALANAQGLASRHPSLVITDILPLNMPRDAGKANLTVHFSNPEMTFDPRTSKEGTHSTEEPSKVSRPEIHSLPSKSELANDLVQIFVAKVETFVTAQVESQFCSEMQKLKTSTEPDFSSSIHQELKRFLATQHSSMPNYLEDIFHSYNNSVLANKEKTEQALPMSFSNLKTYAQEVARILLQRLKHGLDKEVEKILTTPIIFSESIAASQVVNMVLAIFTSHEHQAEVHHPLSREESMLEKLIQKNPDYKKDLLTQIQDTVETALNEVYQTIMLETGSSPPALASPEKFHTSGMGESQPYQAAADALPKALSKPAVAKSDVSLVSNDLVDIVLEDLGSAVVADLNNKGTLPARLQSLLYDLVQKTVRPLAQMTMKGTEVSPEAVVKYLVENISLRLESFAEEKLESELARAAHRENQFLLEGGCSAALHDVGLLPREQRRMIPSPRLRSTEVKAGCCREKAKTAVQDSLTNLRLCAEKLTFTILKLIQKDLEQERLSCQNSIPYKENASANAIVNDLLKTLSVQTALTENEVQKSVLKRIFRRKQSCHKGTCPLLARVEDVLSQVTQRIVGDLGHLPFSNTDSTYFNSESMSSTYNGLTEMVSQVQAGSVASDIVDGVLNKLYTVVLDALFSSSESKSDMDSSSSNKGLLSTEESCRMGKSDLQKMTLALSHLQPPPHSLGEEMVQNVLKKIASFVVSNLEEILPLAVQHKPTPLSLFQCDMQAGDSTTCRPTAFSDDSETSFIRDSLSKPDLTSYAKDVVSTVLGTIMDEFKTEDYYRTILGVNTLSPEQIAIASDIIHSIIQDLYRDEGQMCHLHKHPSPRRLKVECLPSTQMFFQSELAMKDHMRAKPKCVFYDDFSSYLKQVLPREGILREIFERQPLTDANINETLKMLQVAENIVSEVFMRMRDLEPSVSILKKIPGELGERFLCYSFKRAETPGLFYSDSQAEIGSVARDIIASVFENVHKCLAHSLPSTPDRDFYPGRRDRAPTKGPTKIRKHRFTQPEFPFYNVSLKGSVDTIDRIAKDTVECVILTLETFITRHFRRDFKCNFLEIVKFPLESLSFTQLTRSLDSLPTQADMLRNKMPGTANKGTLPTLGSAHDFLDISKLGSAITKECIESAIRQVQMLYSELSVYANNAVSGILEIIKRTLDKELRQKESTTFSSSSESLVLSETISVMLDRCNESLTEITSELMVENLQLEMSGRALAKEKAAAQDLCVSPRVKTTTKRYRQVEQRDTFPPINVPGMVIYSEEETDVQEEMPSKLPSVFRFSECDPHAALERYRGKSCCMATPKVRPTTRRGQEKAAHKGKVDFLEDHWLPRQSPIPEGTILEKLFKKTEDCEAVARLPGPRQRGKAGPFHCEHLVKGPPLVIPETMCCSAICPLKLGHIAESIVSTLLCEFGLENEPAIQARCYEKIRHLLPAREDPLLEDSMLTRQKRKKQGLLGHWEKRLSESSDKTTSSTEDSLLSKWESKQHIFKTERPRDLELLACAHRPDPCEIQLLANHIVLSVVKELIMLRTREYVDEKAYGPSWKQELLQSESKWLKDKNWRSVYLPHNKKSVSCLDLLWDPLTQSVVSNILASISNTSARQSLQERSELFEGSLSTFYSVDSHCPKQGLKDLRSSPINIEELASHISTLIIGILCEGNILQETVKRRGFSERKSKLIYVPPLCLADFDDVYHHLVMEVTSLLSLEIESKDKHKSKDKGRDSLAHQHFNSSSLSKPFRGDCRGPNHNRGITCLSALGPNAHKNQRLSCIASNLDSFIHSLKTSESKHIVNKVLNIILDSLWSDQHQGSFAASFPDAKSQNAMLYGEEDLPLATNLFYSSGCPHAYKLSNNVLSSNLGLSPKSIILLDVVSEKLIRALLEKCLMTDNFTSTFAFDEFPENKQLCDIQHCISDDELGQYSSKGVTAHRTDSQSSIFTYNIRYTEEPLAKVQSGLSSYESALDILAHTLVKPVMTELALSIEQPWHIKAYSRKAVGFPQQISRKPHGQPSIKKHAKYSKSDVYSSSLQRGRKPDPKATVPGRRQMRKNAHEKNKSILETAMQHRVYSSKPVASTGRQVAKKPYSVTYSKKVSRREVFTVTERGDHSPSHLGFSTIYSAIFLEEVISQLLMKIFSSLRTRYDSVSCMDLKEMNTLFVNMLVEELKKAEVGVLERAEEKTYFPIVDNHTTNKIVDSILREFGFQLASDKNIAGNIEMLTERAAEIILMEILDYQLPPPVCRRLPQSAYKHIDAERIIQRVEHCIHFPRPQRQKQAPPTYITVLSQKYLERVINRLLAQFFPPPESTTQKQDRWETSGVNFDELCAYMINQVMKSISKHKIWVAKKDDRCHLHSKKEIQSMVDSVYQNILTKSGSRVSIQKDVVCRSTTFVDSITSFIIQEITKHHLQTFLSKDELPGSSPDTEALSENIVKTVLESLGEPPPSQTGVFPAKFLEEIVSRVLANIFSSRNKKEVAKDRQHETDFGKMAKQLASSINLQFGRAAVTNTSQQGEEQTLAAPLTDVMDDVVNSVCYNISKGGERVPGDSFGRSRDRTIFEDIKRWVEKGISDCLLHPLFSGDLPRASPWSANFEDAQGDFREAEERDENRSPFSTFLSSGFLKDLITGLLTKIFPSTPSRDVTSPQETGHLLGHDLSKMSTQLLDDVRTKLLKHEIRVTKDTHPEQYDYSEEDVQYMTDTLRSQILQKAGSMEAVQRDVKSKSNTFIDRVAGFLVGDILQQHVQPFVCGQAFPAWNRGATGDSTGRGGVEIYRTVIKPLEKGQAPQEKRGSPSPRFLREIISELCSKFSDTVSGLPLGASGDNMGDTAVKLARSLTKEFARLSIQGDAEEMLGSAPEDRPTTGWNRPCLQSNEDTDDDGNISPHPTTTVVLEEIADYHLQSPCPSNLLEARGFIPKKQIVDQDTQRVKPPEPYTTVLSYPVLQAIVDKLLSQIFPLLSDSAECSGQSAGLFGSELCNRIAQIKEDIMSTILKQAICSSTYGNEKETSISEEVMEKMVESVYCDILHEVLLQQPLPEDRESLSNLYVTKIACFIINEMFKHHLQPLMYEEAPPSSGFSPGEIPSPCITVFPCRLLEDMLRQLLQKIFPSPESIAAYTGKQADFSESDFNEMAANLKSYVIMEILAHKIKLENTSERIPDMDQETEEDIASSVYNQILQKMESQNALQDVLMNQGNAAVHMIASLLIRELLHFHLHPFLSGNDSFNSECAQWQKERQVLSSNVYSAMFLEDVVVAFFCNILSSPNILAYSKDNHLSDYEMRELVIKLVNALINEFKTLEIKVIQTAEDNLYFPQVSAEDVIQISSSIYETLSQTLGSEREVFKAFQKQSQALAEQLAPVIVREISGYQFQPLLTGDTSSYLFAFLEAETIVDRVETILPDTSSAGPMYGEVFSKILHRIFPSWAPKDVDVPGGRDPTIGKAVKKSPPLKHGKEKASSGIDGRIQSFVGNIYKTICSKSGSPSGKQDSSGAAQGLMGLISKARQDYQSAKSISPPNQADLPVTLTSKAAGWTIHHVKLGDGEAQSPPAEDGGGVYSSTFLKDIFSGLISKLISSTTDTQSPEKKEMEAEPLLQNLVESIVKEFAKSPIKVLQLPEGGQATPVVGQTEIAKIIHASLCGILQDRGSGVPICRDVESDRALAERLASSIRQEILGYQIQGMPTKTPQGTGSKPIEFGEMTKKVLMEVKKINTQCQTTTPYPLLMSRGFVHDILTALLAKILPLPTRTSPSSGAEDQLAEFDFIHMKLLSKVLAEISKDKNTEIQYFETTKPNRAMSQTIANSVYGNLLPEFGTSSAVEKCIRAGCTILTERIADFVIKEISGNQMQTYLSDKLNQQQQAEAERDAEEQSEDGPEWSDSETMLQSHLKGLSSLIIEEVAAKLLSKMFQALPIEDLDARSVAFMKDVARKIINSVQRFISRKKLKVWQSEDDGEDLGSEDSRAVGEVVDSVYTNILKHSSSQSSLYEDLTNKNEDFVNKVACFMVREISRHDFQPTSDSEDEFTAYSTPIKLESEKIVKKFLSDMELGKFEKDLEPQFPVVPVVFLEEILSRLLTKILIAQSDVGFPEKKVLSKTDVNEIADELKTSVEKEMSKNKIGLVASTTQSTLGPQYEQTVNQVVHSVFSNVLEKSGSQQEMYNDMTNTKAIFPQEVASIIINEISSCSITNPFSENTENETKSALELDRIVSKVLAQVSSHLESDELSLTELSALPATADEPTPEDLLKTSEMPVKIVPYLGGKPLKIDPDIIAEHLAVLSIKTEPLEKLKKSCLSRTGISLKELRRASVSGKSLFNDLPVREEKAQKERRPSLDMSGRLGVMPKEAVCRNSFQSLMRPEITRVELLKDVESKEDLIVRLVAHDISGDHHYRSESQRLLDTDSEEEEVVIREDKSYFFSAPTVAPEQESKAPPHTSTEPLLAKTSSTISRKMTRSLSRCCQALTLTSPEEGEVLKEKRAVPPMHLPQIEITSSSPPVSINIEQSDFEKDANQTFASSFSDPKVGESNTSRVSHTELSPELSGASEIKEQTLEEALVGMHLCRDTEETSGSLEITSVYQDQKIKESVSQEQTENKEEDMSAVTATTSSDMIVPLRQRSSVFEKVSSALSRVFSRTSTTNLNSSATGQEKPSGDQT